MRNELRAKPAAVQALPDAISNHEALIAALAGRSPLLFLDYDGTLAPIAATPEGAVLSPDTRDMIRRVAATFPTAVVSGRQLADVRERVSLAELYYSGNHGFEIAGPPWSGINWEYGSDYADEIAALAEEFATRLPPVAGLIVEHKRYSLSLHYRQISDEQVPPLQEIVSAALIGHPQLTLRHGKRIFEIRPDVDWHKGKAVLRLMEFMDVADPVPVFIGDDLTDEDAFAAIAGFGVGILVSELERPTAASFRVSGTDDVRRLLGFFASE